MELWHSSWSPNSLDLVPRKKKLNLREVIPFIHHHTVGQWQDWDSNPEFCV
jgi:hypothetical protein